MKVAFRIFLEDRGIAESDYLAGPLEEQVAVIAAFEKSEEVAASKKRITVYDVVPNLLKGEYIKATQALIHLNPELTLTTTTGATAFTYLKLFVPWRHHRMPYNESQLPLRQSLGSSITNPAVKRAFFVVAIISWASGKYMSFR